MTDPYDETDTTAAEFDAMWAAGKPVESAGRRALIAYEFDGAGFGLEAGVPGRGWMDATYRRSAYKCLPMLIANQAGWMILNPQPVRFLWDGRPELDAIKIEEFIQDPGRPPAKYGAMSHFGSGIVTWTIPYLFRTPPGYNLHVRGPANMPKDGVCALEGVVETDWAPATFTMNWKITRPDMWVTFDQDEPICMISPQRRGELEEFLPQIQPIASNTELQARNEQWQRSRDEFNQNFADPDSEAAKAGWEKTYFRGSNQAKLRLTEFTSAPHPAPCAD